MNRLLPCPSCARHVRSDELRCPFCDGVQPASRALAPIHRPAQFHAKRLGRAALLVGSAALAGCGSSTGLEPIDPAQDAATAPDAGSADGGLDAGRLFADAGRDAGGVIAAYGGPGLIDAGVADAGPDSDAGHDAGEPSFPAYGAPSADAGPADAGPDAARDAGQMSVPLYGGPGPIFGLDAGEQDAGDTD